MLIPERAVVVKHVYQLAGAGYGSMLIVKKLIEEKVPPFKGAHWSRSFIVNLIRDRRGVGEHQPTRRAGKEQRVPDGDPIPGDYPAAVSEEEWAVAHPGRDRSADRIGKHVEIFSRGMLRDAHDGGTYLIGTRTNDGKQHRLDPDRIPGRPRAMRVLPSVPFERAIREPAAGDRPARDPQRRRRPRRIPGPGRPAQRRRGPHREAGGRAGQRRRGRTGPGATPAGRPAAGPDRAPRQANEKASHPLSETWGECRTLLETLDAAADAKDARVRLRAALQRIVGGIWVLAVPRGRDRICAVQVWFAGDKKHRDYLIWHQMPRASATARRMDNGGAGRSPRPPCREAWTCEV